MAIVLDRRCTIRLVTETVDQTGDVEKMTADLYSTWCNTRSAGSIDVNAPEGRRNAELKDFIVRWDRRLLDVLPGLLLIRDEYGRCFHVEVVDELEATSQRRRFIRLNAAGVSLDPECNG